MKRLAAIAIAFAFVWSLALGHADGFMLCLHQDGSSHLIEKDQQQNSAAPSGFCAHSCSDHPEQNQDASSEGSCHDVEIAVPDLDDLQSISSPTALKAPTLFVSFIENFFRPTEAIPDFDPLPPTDAPPSESPSRRFAKTIQIRC